MNPQIKLGIIQWSALLKMKNECYMILHVYHLIDGSRLPYQITLLIIGG